jgi:hypothetical protein
MTWSKTIRNVLKKERDLLAQAIAEMAIRMGHISPDAVITGPTLLMYCKDVVSS